MDFEKLYRVAPGTKVSLKNRDPEWEGVQALKRRGIDVTKDKAKDFLAENLKELAEAQEQLYADDRYSVLIIFQAMDAAGKDSTIKHVMSGVNPQGCQVFSFKKPSAEDIDHNFLWRHWRALPERGRIGIFNRSYYEDVLVVRVHPEILDAQRLPTHTYDKEFWQGRYDDINATERHLSRNGTLIMKFFLHVSKDEQKKRFLERLERPEKNWKFSMADVQERTHWDQYMDAYEKAMSATSTKWASWYIIPADHKWLTRAIVSEIITEGICALKPSYPKLSEAQRKELAEARKLLEKE